MTLRIKLVNLINLDTRNGVTDTSVANFSESHGERETCKAMGAIKHDDAE